MTRHLFLLFCFFLFAKTQAQLAVKRYALCNGCDTLVRFYDSVSHQNYITCQYDIENGRLRFEEQFEDGRRISREYFGEEGGTYLIRYAPDSVEMTFDAHGQIFDSIVTPSENHDALKLHYGANGNLESRGYQRVMRATVVDHIFPGAHDWQNGQQKIAGPVGRACTYFPNGVLESIGCYAPLVELDYDTIVQEAPGRPFEKDTIGVVEQKYFQNGLWRYYNDRGELQREEYWVLGEFLQTVMIREE